MKLIKQIKLFFQEGTSDKVYEIDLCEAGEGFLVNFRYGRRGASLKEGTKTIFPVAIAEAEKLFDALEQEKRKKGYVAAGESPSIDSSANVKPKPGNDKRKKAIIKLLKTAVAGEEPEHWQLSRIVWRAGDLKITEAIPYIVKLADPSDPALIYSAVWAIGRCGTSDAFGFLQNLQPKGLAPHTVRLLIEAQLKLAEGKDKQILLEAITQTLPAPFRKSIGEKNYRQLEKELREYLFELKTSSNEYLITLYQLSREDNALQEVFLRVLAEIPFQVNYFTHIRHIFKTAAMLQDYEVFGVIAKQIEKQPYNYKPNYWVAPEQKKNLAFSSRTKAYLAKRVVRNLRKYGEAGEDSYVSLATGILLAFDDAMDYVQPHHTSQFTYSYNRETRTHNSVEQRKDFDSYSKYQSFNYILYKNSPRYQPTKHNWICVPPYKPGDKAPANREEAYPHLWDKAGEEIIQLLCYSKCLRVHEFALKVWRANPDFAQQVDIQTIIRLLQVPFEETQKVGLALAVQKYDRSAPDALLLIAMLDSGLEEARKQAELWIAEQRTTLLADTEFIFSLLLMKKTESHAWLRSLLATTTFNKDQAEIIVAKVIAYMMAAPMDTEVEKHFISQLGDSLLIGFAESLRYISLGIIKDLFTHSAAEIHTFAGKILLKHEIEAAKLPEDFLQLLLQSPHVDSRAIGISLLGKFPEALLLQRKEMLVSFCLSPLADVRNAIKPVILKLIRAYPEFGTELVNLFVPAFLIKESYEGVHEDLLSLLSNELQDSLHIIPKEKVLLLLQSRYRTSQRIGNVLLKKNVKEEELTVAEMVKLSSNALEEVRKFSWKVFSTQPDKVKAAKEDALRMTDSSWDDTRIFAFEYFRNTFTAREWNTDLLVMLCDSTKEDVQAFAREMITRFFEAQQGTEYLLKLSQHPSTKVQLFTTAYLEQFAVNNTPVLQSLKLYFITLLSQVNKGKTAKARVMAFLRRESLKNKEAALLVSEILTRISVSMAITEKAECIGALRDIRLQFPDIESPLLVKGVSDYVNV